MAVITKQNQGKTIALVFLFFSLFPSFSFGADFEVPKQTIQGAEQPIPLGEMVDLSVSPIEKKPPHLHSVVYSWKVFDGSKEKKVRQVDNGVFFGAGLIKKKMSAMCIITYLFVVKDNGTVKDPDKDIAARTVILTAEITIGDSPGPNPGPDPGPNPGPDPNPTPTPEPDLPDGEFKLAKFAYRAASLEVKDAKARVKGAAALKTAFEGIAASIAAGVLDKPADILKKTKEANDAALQRELGSVTDWENFSTKLQEYLYQLYKDNKLKTKQQYQTAWKEIALGLSKITK